MTTPPPSGMRVDAIVQVFENLLARFSRDSRVAVAGDVLVQLAAVLDRLGNDTAAARVHAVGLELLEEARASMRHEVFGHLERARST
jgi:hypothetical protein